MGHQVYILFSALGNTFYIGESENVHRRIEEHNLHIYTGSQTIRYNDWCIFLTIDCIDRVHARKIEGHIKKMKSKKYIENLKKYPEMSLQLIEKYK